MSYMIRMNLLLLELFMLLLNLTPRILGYFAFQSLLYSFYSSILYLSFFIYSIYFDTKF